MDIDISTWGMVMTYLLLAPGLYILYYYRLGLFWRTLYAVARMTVQLLLIGIFLQYLFRWHNVWINILWLLVMIGFACGGTLSQSCLHYRKLLLPGIGALVVATFGVVLYFMLFIAHKGLGDAAMLIPIAGMLLGNSMRGNVVALDQFYSHLREDENSYLMRIVYGATPQEAVFPYIQQALKTSLGPHIVTMLTLGIVSLPGMMSGQLLGGSTPLVAIKYQIAIMIGIFTVMCISSALLIKFTLPGAFLPDSRLNQKIFK